MCIIRKATCIYFREWNERVREKNWAISCVASMTTTTMMMINKLVFWFFSLGLILISHTFAPSSAVILPEWNLNFSCHSQKSDYNVPLEQELIWKINYSSQWIPKKIHIHNTSQIQNVLFFSQAETIRHLTLIKINDDFL